MWIFLSLASFLRPFFLFLFFEFFCHFSIQSNAKGIKGNIRGDGLLNGGMLIVTAGGEKVLLSHKQASPGDHVSNEQILDVLGITSDEPKEGESESTSASAGATCPDSACTVKEGES